MDMKKLACEIIEGRRLGRDDDLRVFETCDLGDLRAGADMLRAHFIGDKIDLCAIINGKSGRCSENCKYCAQSAHYETQCKVHDFLPLQTIMDACEVHAREGVDRFSIVTSGHSLTDGDFDAAVEAFRRMHEAYDIELCASLGFLSAEKLHRLHEAGVSRYHHNIETSRRFFPEICTTHTYDQRLETLKLVKAEGMKVCSGGIIGMGETFDDRMDMALDLAEYEVDSIPINELMPIPGTPLEGRPRLEEDEILRTIALFCFVNPTARIRLAAGRALLTNDGELAFQSGASATITGNMLTTVARATIQSDKQLIKKLGRQ